MVRLTKNQARDLVRGKLNVCEYCKSRFDSKELLLEHLKEVHGKHSVKKRTKRKYNRRDDPFDPEEVIEYWEENYKNWKKIGSNNPYNKKDIRDLVMYDKLATRYTYEDSEEKIYVNIAYVWDGFKSEYRIFTVSNDTVFGPFTEIVQGKLNFEFKNYEKLKEDYKEKKAIERVKNKK